MSRRLYSTLAYLLLPYAVYRLIRRHGWRHVLWAEYFGYFSFSPPVDRPVIWIHTVSVGEAVAAEAFSRRLAEAGNCLLLTATTTAGREWLKQHHPDAVVVALPLDLPGVARRFIRRARPQLGVFVEAEYWPNLILTAKENGVRLFLANARLSGKSARCYRWSCGLMRRCIEAYDAIAAQTARDAGRLRCYGGKAVTTTGNLKFDRQLVATPKKRMSDKPTLLIAAARTDEEQALLAVMDSDFWRQFFVIWAPRHPERTAGLVAALKAREIRYITRSSGEAVKIETALYLADTLGEMDKWYAACDAAVIGGGFMPHGGQNPIEAMEAGVAAVIGPHVENYAHLVRRAVTVGALAQAPTAAAAVKCACSLATEGQQTMQTAAAAFCAEQRGALAKHLAIVKGMMEIGNGGQSAVTGSSVTCDGRSR